MTKIITFISPKAAGASTVSLNFALLHQALNPKEKTAFIELSPWSSQGFVFKAGDHQHWGHLTPFVGTKEWNKSLLPRVSFDLQSDLFFSPQGSLWPVFKAKWNQAFLNLLKEHYDTIIIDLSISAGPEWSQFYLKQSHLVIGVVAPDPTSLNAFENWKSSISKKINLGLVINQVPTSEIKYLKHKFSNSKTNFLGTLRSEPLKFWYHLYQAFPPVWQKRSVFKKDLLVLHSKILETL